MHSRVGSVLIIILFIGGLSACKDVMSNLESKPRALGKTNEVVVICDDNVWDTFVQDTVSYYFEAPYPIMPQPEPVFDVRRFSTEDLMTEPLRRELRTYVILANLKDTESATTKMVLADLGEERLRRATEDENFISTVGREKWANGQLLVYVFGFGLDALANHIVKAYPSIAQRIHEHDYVQIDASTYMTRESALIEQQINQKFGIHLKIPGNYRTALEKDNFIWIRQDFEDAISNIAIMRFPYAQAAQLDQEGIIQMLDRLGVLIEGTTAGSVMRTNAEDLPVYLYRKELDGHFVVEARGIWELTDDFLGGPFVAYAVVDEGEILLIDTFVHAPGEIKRDYVQRLEHIISSLKFTGQ